MRVLIACESSGTVRDAFRAVGIDAVSCDILPSAEWSAHHIQGDAIRAIRSERWALVIAHPPCTHLCASGARHWQAKRADGRQEAGIAFFRAMVDACEEHAQRYAIENPVGIMSRLWRRPDQIIQPYQYGEDASKRTCLWLKGLPALTPTGHVRPRMVDGKPRWNNQTDSGQNRLSPSADRWQQRSKTYSGIASAMASQWGKP